MKNNNIKKQVQYGTFKVNVALYGVTQGRLRQYTVLTKCKPNVRKNECNSFLFFQRLLSNEEEKNKEIIQEVCFMVSFIIPRSF